MARKFSQTISAWLSGKDNAIPFSGSERLSPIAEQGVPLLGLEGEAADIAAAIPGAEEARGNGLGDSTPNGTEFSKADWKSEEERQVVRKLDRIVMPILILNFIGLQLDRGNISNALTDNFFQDVGITQDQFNVGMQLLHTGIVLLEIPSNMILYYIGPRYWLGGQVVAWSLVSIFQSFQHGYPAFLLTRLLLGLCEAGFIPASLYVITMWYKNDEISARFSWFFLGNYFATAAGGVLAYGILQMRGIAGLTGWQWLFILEGLYTFFAGILLFCLLPESRDDPYPSTSISYFTERERYIISRRIPLDDPLKAGKRRSMTVQEVLRTLGNWTLWPHIALCLAQAGPGSALQTYAPSLVAGFGFDPIASNAYTSIGTWLMILVTPIAGRIADRTRRRGLVILGIQVLMFAFSVGNYVVIDSSNKNLRLVIMLGALTFRGSWHPVNNAWLAINAGSTSERNVRMACIIMAANTAGIYGSTIFAEHDAPVYYEAFRNIISILAFALACSVFTNAAYRALNRRAMRQAPSVPGKARMYSL